MELVTAADYLNLGAGGIAILALIGLFWYSVKALKPILLEIQSDSNAHSEIVRNNTDAIKEVSRSNDNVAKALEMLNMTLEHNNKLFEVHDARTIYIESEIIKISERTNKCLNRL